MDHKRSWVYCRSNVVDRLQKEELGPRLKLYKGLESILSKHTEDSENEELKMTALKKEAHSSHEDSALGMSLHGEMLNGTAVEPQADNLKEEAVTEITDTLVFDSDREESSLSLFQNAITEISDWDRAEGFHAALGPELDVVRQQIASILQEGPILFPLELISRLYIRYGRRLPQLYEEYSSKDLLAWLKLISQLELDNLIYGL